MLLPPLELYLTQLAFAQVITNPIENEKWAIYHRLYWCRISRFFYETYPFLTRLFGYQEIQEVFVIPYLHKHPPSHWLLSRTGDHFLEWATTHYSGTDRTFVLEVIQLETLYARVKRGTFSTYPEATSTQKIYLQPHVELGQFSFDVIVLRHQFLKESVEYWQERSFPKIDVDENIYCAIFLSLKEGVQSLKISQKEFALLHTLKTGKSLEDIVGMDPENSELPFWIYDWAQLGLLAGEMK